MMTTQRYYATTRPTDKDTPQLLLRLGFRPMFLTPHNTKFVLRGWWPSPQEVSLAIDAVFGTNGYRRTDEPFRATVLRAPRLRAKERPTYRCHIDQTKRQIMRHLCRKRQVPVPLDLAAVGHPPTGNMRLVAANGAWLDVPLANWKTLLRCGDDCVDANDVFEDDGTPQASLATVGGGDGGGEDVVVINPASITTHMGDLRRLEAFVAGGYQPYGYKTKHLSFMALQRLLCIADHVGCYELKSAFRDGMLEKIAEAAATVAEADRCIGRWVLPPHLLRYLGADLHFVMTEYSHEKCKIHPLSVLADFSNPASSPYLTLCRHAHGFLLRRDSEGQQLLDIVHRLHHRPTHLYLTGNISCEMAARVARLTLTTDANGTSSLRRFHADMDWYTRDPNKIFVAMGSTVCDAIREVDMSGTDRQLDAIVVHCRNLTALGTGCGIHAKDETWLKFFAAMPQLTTFCVSRDTLSRNVLAALAHGLPNLTFIDIDSHNVDDEFCDLLSTCCPRLKAIKMGVHRHIEPPFPLDDARARAFFQRRGEDGQLHNPFPELRVFEWIGCHLSDDCRRELTELANERGTRLRVS